MNTPSPVRGRILISHAHGEHADLSQRLKRDPAECGHEVRIDSGGIIPGTPDREHSIEYGIAWLAETPDQGRMPFLAPPRSATAMRPPCHRASEVREAAR